MEMFCYRVIELMGGGPKSVKVDESLPDALFTEF